MASPFPDDFRWGTATSSYQIEGAPLADGAGPSIWHHFSHTPGRVADGATGDVACDHYHRFREDVDLLRALGVGGYRFSVAWGRVLPDGTGAVNDAGLAFYDRLVDALLEAGIEPLLTLYHWDLPAALYHRGGWLNRDVAGWFADYAAALGRRLGDRVRRWCTINEPWVVATLGHLTGQHAPGQRNLYEAPIVTHNLLRAHGAAVDALRAEDAGAVGLVVNLEPKYPASDRPEDHAAVARGHAFQNRQYLDPLFFGTYPDELRDLFGDAWPDFPAADFDLIRRPGDFVGVNYYTRGVTADAPDAPPLRFRTVRQPRHAYTAMDWEVYPQGLTDILTWVHETYGGPPLYVTENGAAFYDAPTADGDTVEDPHRAAYLRDHLRACRRALDAGVDLRGYYAWSLMDNFEWAEGYDKRFGLVHVDFETQRRTFKRSARVYADVVASNGASLD